MLTAPQIEQTAMMRSVAQRRTGAEHGDEDAARSDAEERQPDDEVGVVVPELERDDAGVADLEQETRQADEEDHERAAAGRALVVGHSAHRQTPLENGGSYRAR